MKPLLGMLIAAGIIAKALAQQTPPVQQAPAKPPMPVNVQPSNLPPNPVQAPQALPPNAQGAPAAAQAAGQQLPPPAPAPSAQPLSMEASKPADILAGVIEDYNYAPEGKRDPFSPFEADRGGGASVGPVYPLQKFDMDQLRLVGIIWDVAQPKALIMDPTGHGHVVKLNEKVGRNNGYIARIREGEIVVIEGFKGQDGKVTYQTRIMKLSTE